MDLDPSPTTPASRSPWFGSELAARVVSGCVLGVVALLATLYGGWPFALLWLIAGAIIAYEFLTMIQVRSAAELAAIATAGLVACSLPFLFEMTGWVAAAAALATALALCLRARTSRDALWTVAAFAYAAVIVTAMPLLREQAPFGLVVILWMFAVVWATDIVAYFAGRRFGGPKLWPAVSPKKTWSGAIAGSAAGTLAGVAVVLTAARWWGIAPPFGFTVIAIGSAAASIAGQLGDLGESALKRQGGVKDSGQLIPGHGGVMDRLDALWAVALLAGCSLLGARLVQH